MADPVDHVGFHARAQPGELAALALESGRSWSWADLDRDIGACVRLLVETHGARPGDRIATLARNCVELVTLHLACARAGLIYVPLNWRLAAAEIKVLLEDCEPRLLLGDASLSAVGVGGLDLADFSARIQATAPLSLPAPNRDQPSLILYTSGTSGRPKGVLLSERNLDQTALNFSLVGEVDRQSRVLIDAPMFHVIGLVTSVRPALLQGGVILVSDGFRPERTLARLGDRTLGATHYFCVPQMAAQLRSSPDYRSSTLHGLKALFTGGAPHPAADILAILADGVPIADGFGMSEAGTVFGMPLSRPTIAAKAGSVGFGTSGVQVRIVDAADQDCPSGVPGEVLLKGENIFSGYWRRPAETRAAFTPDGWFRTGDIALRDDDGFYWIVDRKKDMFISGGENVYPAEVEAALADYPGLRECAVVGAPDPQWGEVGHCALAAHPGHDLDIDDLRELLRGRLAHYKVPKVFRIVESLPRTGSGKVVKSELKALLGL